MTVSRPATAQSRSCHRGLHTTLAYVVVMVACTPPCMPILCLAVLLCHSHSNRLSRPVSHSLCVSPALPPSLQDMMREFLEREKRKQAEREAAKAEKQAAAQQAA